MIRQRAEKSSRRPFKMRPSWEVDMKRSVGAVCVGVCILLASACARPTFDFKTEEAKLLARDAEWSTAAAEGKDVDKVVSYWTDDAFVLPPGRPAVEGKAALRAFVTESFKIPGFQIRWKSEKVAFSPDGRLAYMRSTNEMTVPGPDGKPTTMKGRGMTVWRVDGDGQWRCAADVWNAPPAS
jgi:ketosteroid isomerase-like protein